MKENLVQMLQIYSIYNAWQPSLVLGGLGRARNGPYSLQRLYLGLALQAY